jgi:hypothetical protein
MKRILVQAGHMPPLEPGFEADTGAAGEAKLVADIQKALVRLLKADDAFDPLPMPGRIPPHTRADAALYLHADGVDDPSATGYGFGYPDDPINKRLADLISKEFQKIPGHPRARDNNITEDRHQYYGFRLVDSPGPEVLIEHGFVSKPGEHRWLTAHVDALARAEYHALRTYFKITSTPAHAPAAHAPAAHAPHAPAGDPLRITPHSSLHAPPRAGSRRAIAYLLGRAHGEYTDEDVRTIVASYYKTAEAVGLDPLLVVAQMALETGGLTSFWSQRPRRNPAGIGVTGKPGEGVMFPSWKKAVRAHAGRLLAYVLAAGHGTAAQRALITEALAVRPLPADKRGVAPTLGGLEGTWAADPRYAEKLVALGNEMLAA